MSTDEGYPDQGLHYELAAAVAAAAVLDPLTVVHPAARVVPLDTAGLGMLPVTTKLAAVVTPAMICTVLPSPIAWGPESTGRGSEVVTTGSESGFYRLTPGLLALLEAGSAAGPIAYLEADYVGREGHQTAAVWRDGALVRGPMLLGRNEPFSADAAPISVALRELGVIARGRRDEFLVAGLGRHRRTEDWVRGMYLDWHVVKIRYQPGTRLRPLAGGSTLEIVSIDDDRICVKHRLWQDCVTRGQLDTAFTLLHERTDPIDAIAFAEVLRRHYAGGPDVVTDCSRIPNLSAIVLKDLGYLVA